MKYKPYSKELDTIAYFASIISFICLLVYVYAVYRYDFKLNSIIPPCSFHSATGFFCPGCGGTRAFMYMLSCNFIKSLLYHPIVLYVTVPGTLFFVSQSIYRIRRLFTRNTCESSPEKYCYHVMSIHPLYIYTGCALLVLHWIIKNVMLFI